MSVETPMVETDKRVWFQCTGLLIFYFILRIRYKISLAYNGKSFFFFLLSQIGFFSNIRRIFPQFFCAVHDIMLQIGDTIS